ncbi:MAG TPA: ribosome-associated translation inhibitor RaiA [Candidatus Stercoripulliclostridium merdigallinarum]|uniref:Ribosome hibernation promoting factor n=1 Tax=Candidatus Stercoripulliclostridium merdigallinarum TaxID=2840951 RepID=A0A9D1SI12_9FIRM|nr:ribosome-associated translation inhibitor RaiA [Candidatus Stercoripulliclostridium merdigallinarum]
MKIELVSKNYNEGSRLVGVIEKKLGKLDKYFSGDADALVKLSTVGNDKFTMEITVRFGGYIARAEVTGSNMYDNIDLILPKLEKQIARFRDRMNSKVPKKALPLKTDVEEAAAPREYYGNIVKEKHFDISIVTVDEAIAEMELLDHDFYVFVNAENNRVSVVYKRHDGDYGLITPEY